MPCRPKPQYLLGFRGDSSIKRRILNTELTDRQQRELNYHREHAELHSSIVAAPFDWGVLQDPDRRWWNAYWAMYAHLVGCDLEDKDVLVVGCGFGDDALRLAKLGANVSAFDLSPDSLGIAKELALREGLIINFEQMPAEALHYENNTFDLILSRDIFHHVDIPQAMHEIVRVARPGARLVVNEVYSHSITNKIRYFRPVDSFLYPKIQEIIYGQGTPYITEDERKLDEFDLTQIMGSLEPCRFVKYFNFLVTRVIPDRFETIAKADRLLLRSVHPIAHLLAGRVLLSGRIAKSGVEADPVS